MPCFKLSYVQAHPPYTCLKVICVNHGTVDVTCGGELTNSLDNQKTSGMLLSAVIVLEISVRDVSCGSAEDQVLAGVVHAGMEQPLVQTMHLEEQLHAHMCVCACAHARVHTHTATIVQQCMPF